MQTRRRLLPGLAFAGIIIAMASCALIWTAKRAHLSDSDLKTTAIRSPPVNSAVLSTQEPAPATPLVPDQTLATGYRSDNPVLARFLDPHASDRLTGDFSTSVTVLTDPKAFAAVRFLLRDHREALPLRNEAANLLRRSGDAQLDDELTAILADEHELEDIRSYAAQHLGVSLAENKDTRARQLLAVRLAAALDDRHRAVRREALLALVNIGDHRGLDEVTTGLGTQRWQHDRDLIIRCLYDLGKRDFAPKIRPFTDDQDDDARIAALYVLGQWQDTESRSAFERALTSPTERVKRAGALALSTLTAATTQVPMSKF